METSFAHLIYEIKSTFRGEPHTFTEIRYMLEDARLQEVSYVEVIRQHHSFLNESIVILIDPEPSISDKQLHLDRFLRLLEMHSKAEEETLYRLLARHGSHEVRCEALLGQLEHEQIRLLADELKSYRYRTAWTPEIEKKARVLANSVADHIFEEEGAFFPVANRSLLHGEMLVLVEDYLDLCEFYLDGDARAESSPTLSWPLMS